MREMSTAADPEMLADDAIRTLDSVRGGPFFMTVFFSAAHFPYAAPAPYYARFTDPAYRGRFKYDKPVGLGAASPPDAADIAQIRGLYDGAVASVDAAASRVLEALRARGLDRNTIVVLTADHGETLFDGGHGQGHGDHLFGDEGTHVPLVVLDPREAGRGGRHEPAIARDVDLAPTLYDLTGVEAPADVDGRSLAPAVHGDALSEELAYAETELWLGEVPIPAELRMPTPSLAHLTEVDAEHGDEVVLAPEVEATTLVARHRMVRDLRWKLVYAPTRAGAKYLLFDTERDPEERTDVAAGHPAEVARLKGELWRWMLRDPRMEERGGVLVLRPSSTGAP
jgi:arylsulfatase A-like enzyme